MSKLSTHRMPLVPNSPLSASPALISSVTVSPGSRSSPTTTWPANQSEVSIQLWTNQRQVLWPTDQSQLTWPQYSSSGPIRGKYCGQLANHSTPGHNTHHLDQSEESIVASSPGNSPPCTGQTVVVPGGSSGCRVSSYHRDSLSRGLAAGLSTLII